MSLITFEDDSGGDIECPHCEAKFSLRWETEYGDPVVGEHKEKCPKCGGEILITASHHYTIHKIK